MLVESRLENSEAKRTITNTPVLSFIKISLGRILTLELFISFSICCSVILSDYRRVGFDILKAMSMGCGSGQEVRISVEAP
jgi:hypothetical protein